MNTAKQRQGHELDIDSLGQVLGPGGLHEFLERGYTAFAHMKDGRAFIRTIVERERAEHERLAGGTGQD